MLKPGDVVDGKYKVVRLIGEGGMGAVFEGENTAISRRVAIKVLHAHAALQDDTVMRFKREARAAGKIGNDHILEILDLGELGEGAHYMVMEFLDGEPLSSRIERGVLPPAELVDVASQLLDGLAAAHRAGIIHRDLKPDNVFILKEKAGRPNYVKIIDFGISKFHHGMEDGEMNMTQTGTLMGTPFYMSPEQAKGSTELDHRIDIYAVGVILYECLSGRVPYDANNFNELILKLAFQPAPPITTFVPNIDPRLAEIVHGALAHDRDQRYNSCEALQQDLQNWLQGAGAAAQQGFAPVVDVGLTHAETTTGPSGPGHPVVAPAGTQSNWSQSGITPPIPKTSPVVPLAIAGLVVLLMLGGGAFGVYKYMAGKNAQAAAAETLETDASATPTDTEDSATPPASETAAPKNTEAPAPSASAPSADEGDPKKPVANVGAKPIAKPIAAKPTPIANPGPKPGPKPAPKPTPKPGMGGAQDWY